MGKKLKTILFDLDGTLTESHTGIIQSFHYAVKKLDILLPDNEDLHRWIGPPLIDTFKQLCHSDDEAHKGVEYYREYYEVQGMFQNNLYPGINELLDRLFYEGLSLILATSKPEKYALKILDNYNVSRYFTAVSGSSMDHATVSKVDIIQRALSLGKISDANETIMVGDRKYDIEGAAYHNIPSCGVLYGYGSKEELQTAQYIAKDVDQLSFIISSLVT